MTTTGEGKADASTGFSPALFEKMFHRYYVPLCRYANAMVNNAEAAEDIVQELFYVLWEKQDVLAITRSDRGYLYTAARNRALDFLQRERTRRSYAMRNTGAAAHQPAETGEAAEISQVIGRTMKKLPERCALVFALSRFEGKKYAEIAELLSVSEKTVEAEMGKALKIFREELKDYIR